MVDHPKQVSVRGTEVYMYVHPDRRAVLLRNNYHPMHHDVGWRTLEITPSASIHSSLSFIFLQSGSGTCLGVGWENGLALGFMEIFYSSLKLPKQWKSFGKALWITVLTLPVVEKFTFMVI